MIKREKNGKLRGSVLLTVVCVMSLLIVFLFGTLALATAANNRAHVNYSTAQTEVTSRTVVDAAIKGMIASPDYAKVVNKIGTTGGSNSIDIKVQLDENTVPDVGKYGDISRVHIELAGKKKFYDVDKKEWIDGDILKFTSTVSMAGVDSTTSAYIVKQPPTDGDGGGGGGAGFVTTAGAALTCQTNLYGGTYINVPELGEDKNSNGTFEPNDKEGAVFYKYDYRTVDAYDKGWKAGTSDYDRTLYRQFAPYDSADATTFKLDNGGAIAEADLYVNNNMLVSNWSGFIFPDEGKGITVWGDLAFDDGEQSYTSNIKSSTPEETTTLDFNKIPYIYVDGKISQKANTDVYLGNSSDPFPLNIFCGSIDTYETNAANNCHIGGDIYCMNPNETSRIGGNTSSKLYAWSASVVNKTESNSAKPHTTASIYSLNKELILNNMNVSGDVRAEKDCTIQGTVTIDGDLVVGGDLTINGNVNVKGNVIVKGKLELNANLKLSKDSKIYCDSSKATGLDTGVTTDPKYVERSTFVHNASEYPGAERVENSKRYYLEYTARLMTPEDEGYNQWYPQATGLLGEIVSVDSNTVFYYKWKENFDPIETFGTDDTAFYCDYNNYSGLDINNFIETGYKSDVYNDDRPHNLVDGAVEYYYVEKVWDGAGYVTKSVPTDEFEYYVDPSNNHERVTDFRTVPDADGNDKFATSNTKQNTMAEFADFFGGGVYNENSESVWFEIETGYPVSPATANPGSITTYAVPNNLVIYPEYAERDVILGLKQVGSTPIEQTKIVKTFKEVLEKVANPYKEGTLSVELSKQHDELIAALSDETKKSKVYFENVTDILKAYNVYADNIQNDGTYVEATPVLEGNVTFSSAASNKNGGVIIRDDCILNLKDTIGADMGYLVFEPGTKDMLVIVNSLDLSGAKIIVNDSQGGTVNFFIEKKDGSGGIMKLGSTTNFVAPTSYMKAFADSTSDIMSYGNVDKGGLDLNKLGKPHINIYGAPGTELISTESGGFIANIVSSELKFTSSAGTKMPCADNISKIYYNGNEVSNSHNPFIIGCINSSFANVPNGLNVLFVTDSSNTKPNIVGNGEDAFNYRILYYDEY
ncbi:MAG: polymer-forming cytoskeletal protein [Ruminococcus sp.]|nr:polymer-forming cytoskeletal protein [Ruminococcus sp.]